MTPWGREDVHTGIFTLLPTKTVNSDGSGLSKLVRGNVSD